MIEGMKILELKVHLSKAQLDEMADIAYRQTLIIGAMKKAKTFWTPKEENVNRRRYRKP